MITDELIEFIRTQRQGGLSPAEIEVMLTQEGGWDKNDVTEAYIKLGWVKATPQTPEPAPIVQMVSRPAPQTAVQPPVIATPSVPVTATAPVEPSPAKKFVPFSSAIDTPIIHATAVTPPVSPAVPTDDFLGIFADPVGKGVGVPLQSTDPLRVPNAGPATSPQLRTVVFDPLQQFSLKKDVKTVSSASIVQPAPVATPPSILPQAVTAIPVQQPKAESKFSLEQMLSKVGSSSASATAPSISQSFAGNPDQTAKTAVVSMATPAVTATIDNINKSPIPSRVSSWLASPSTPTATSSAAVQTPRAPLLSHRTMESDVIRESASQVSASIPAITPSAPASAQATSKELPEMPPQPVGSKLASVAAPLPIATIASQSSIPSAPATPSWTIAAPVIPDIKNREKESYAKEVPPIDPGKGLQATLTGIKTAPRTPASQGGKKILLIAIILLVTVLVVGGGVFAYMRFSGPSSSSEFAAALIDFMGLTSFSYKGDASVDVTLQYTQNENKGTSGLMKFAASYDGLTQVSPNGYGNGISHFKLNGGLQAPNFAWNDKIEEDVRLVDKSFYFKAITPPSAEDFDPELLKTNWVRIDIAEIAKELSLAGIAAESEGYGMLGGVSKETTLNAIMNKNLPFTAANLVGQENIDGVSTDHYQLKIDQDKALLLGAAMYKKFTGKDLTFDQDTQLRFKDMMQKVHGDVWIDPKTKHLVRIAMGASFDDEIDGVHITGPVSVNFTFNDFNKAVSVDVPAPILTLDDLRVQEKEFQQKKILREHDATKPPLFNDIRTALAAYQGKFHRYPMTLSVLIAQNYLSTSTFGTTTLKQFVYWPYVKGTNLTKAGRCSLKGATCGFYHLGVNFEDITDPLLATDADLTSDVRGSDAAGCNNEDGVACYDVTSDTPFADVTRPPVTNSFPTSSPGASATTTAVGTTTP